MVHAMSKYYLLGVFGLVLRFWSCLKEASTKTARKCPSFSELFWECDKTSSVVSGTFDVTFEINFSYVFNGGAPSQHWSKIQNEKFLFLQWKNILRNYFFIEEHYEKEKIRFYQKIIIFEKVDEVW